MTEPAVYVSLVARQGAKPEDVALAACRMASGLVGVRLEVNGADLIVTGADVPDLVAERVRRALRRSS